MAALWAIVLAFTEATADAEAAELYVVPEYVPKPPPYELYVPYVYWGMDALYA